MNRGIRLSFTLGLLLMTMHRLPAPISEVSQATPSPRPKREATPKFKPKAETTAKPTATASFSFAGTWAGITINKGSDGTSGSSNYIIRISDDEKTVLINMAEVGQAMSGPPTPASCTRFRDALTWDLTNSYGVTVYTMKIISSGTASLLREGRFTGGDLDGVTYTHSGTLSRQDVPSAPPIPQTTTVSSPPITTAAPQTNGLPTARPVPNRPGFVYNPFDPKSQILLDVRGKTSGTKVKDPFSRKLFIVP